MDFPKRKFGENDIMTEHKFPFSGNLVRVTDLSRYNSEKERLRTFASWPSDSAVEPARLAKSGFCYTGTGDEVVCFSCHGHIKDWQYGDIVQRKHMELYPSCDFVNNRSTNVPLVGSKASDSENISRCLSESTVNGVMPVMNGVQKQLSVVETLVDNNSKYLKYMPHPNDLNQIVKNHSEVKRAATPNVNFSWEALFLEMKSEEKRLRTFKNGWPVPFIDERELAKAGFFYLGCGDKVQCPFCGVIVSNWEVGDEPLSEHRRHQASCTFLSALSKQQWYKGKGSDVCGHDEAIFTSSHGDKLLDKSQEHTKLEDLGVSLHRGPAHPQQATLAARLRSFVSWPSTAPVKKEALASAGFFYIGISDHTKCFHCDGGLCSWEDGDDPWVEHARWFRNCSFVRLNKGEEFIKMCVAKYAAAQTKVEEKSSSCSPSDVDILSRIEDAMSSSLIQAVLETGLFPPYLVRAAVLRQLKETGSSFASVDDICEAVAILQHEMEEPPPQPIEDSDEGLMSTLNIEMQPVGQAKDEDEQCERLVQHQGAEVEISESASSTSGCTKPIAACEIIPKKNSQGSPSGALKEENQFLKDQRLCKVCMDDEVGVVFLPCGHLLTCTLCAPALKICPMCRKPIQATVRAYLP